MVMRYSSAGKAWVCMLVAAAIISVAPMSAGARQGAQGTASLKTKLARILNRSGYTYTRAADNVWTVDFKGDSLSEFHLFITSTEDLVIIGAVVAKKGVMRVTPEMMRRLLKLTHDLDRAKIGFDKDDDLFVRVDVSGRLFDDQEFKANIEQVAAVTDRVFREIKPFIRAQR
ncbi:MAG: YbjN domain-containing protein [Blastocatellia bacterium]|nr:YbjN domain-containing protein [Blastocatellia bacterium]